MLRGRGFQVEYAPVLANGAIDVPAFVSLLDDSTAMAIVQLAMFPMLFLSGALFPIHGLPGWLGALTRFDPVTYAVDPLRRAVFGAQHLGAAAAARFGAGVELFGRILPIWTELAIVAVISLIFISWSVREFSRTE